jgi:nitrogen fixation NifU-like protein
LLFDYGGDNDHVSFGSLNEVMVRLVYVIMYSPELLEHFQNPRNVGELEEGAVRVEVSNPACGDIMRLGARFHDGMVAEAKFKVRGCTASIAAGSVLTEMMLGRSREGLAAIRAADIDAALGGLEPASKHVAVLCIDAVKRLLAS